MAVSVLSLSSTLRAASPGSGLSRLEVHFEGALQRVAQTFYPGSGDPLLSIERADELWTHTLGSEMHAYRVATRSGRELGRFFRMRSASRPGTRIDLALDIRNGLLRQVLSIQPTLIANRPCLRFPEILGSLEGLDPVRASRPMARMFRGLVPVLEASPDDVAPVPDAPATRALIRALEAETPPLEIGSRLPEFVAVDTRDRAAGSASLQGRAVIILIGNLSHDMSRTILGRLERLVRDVVHRPVVRVILVDQEADLEEFRARGGTLDSPAILDPRGSMQDMFRVVLTPSILMYNAGGRLEKRLHAPWGTDAELADALGLPPPGRSAGSSVPEGTPDELDLASKLLREGAVDLLGLDEEAPGDLKLVGELERYGEGLACRMYRWVTTATERPELLTHMRIHAGSSSRIEVLVLRHGTRVRMRSLQPIVLDGQAFDRFDRLTALLEDLPLDRVSPGLHDLFKALASMGSLTGKSGTRTPEERGPGGGDGAGVTGNGPARVGVR